MSNSKSTKYSRTPDVEKKLQKFVDNNRSSLDGKVMVNPCGEVVIRTSDYVTQNDLVKLQDLAKENNCFLCMRPSVNDDFDATGEIDFVFDPLS